jgi:Na+/melibiose symporter-like transporter
MLFLAFLMCCLSDSSKETKSKPFFLLVAFVLVIVITALIIYPDFE